MKNNKIIFGIIGIILIIGAAFIFYYRFQPAVIVGTTVTCSDCADPPCKLYSRFYGVQTYCLEQSTELNSGCPTNIATPWNFIQDCAGSSPNCVDSDGEDVYTKGYVTYYGDIIYDTCSEFYADNVMEMTCVSSTGPVGQNEIVCFVGETCSDGKCVSVSAGCTSPAGNDDQYYCSGNGVIRNCYSNGWVVYTYCGGEGYTGDCKTSSVVSASGEADAQSKLCVASSGCSDTDGGIDENVKGVVTDKFGDSIEDYCYDSDEVYEYYCATDSLAASRIILCDGGTCTNGACTVSAECTDTDGGSDSNVKGIVTDKWGDSVSDYCYDVDNVYEYYCASDGNAASTIILCPTNTVCSDGRCVDDTNPCASCNEWVKQSCGAGSCSSTQMQYTRMCTPTGCTPTDGMGVTKCEADASCSIPVCKAYQKLNTEGNCAFSFVQLFTSAGITEFYEDNTIAVIGGGIALLLIIVLVIYLIFKPRRTGGF